MHHQMMINSMNNDRYNDQEYDGERGSTPVPDDNDDQGWGDPHDQYKNDPHDQYKTSPGDRSPSKKRDPRRDPRMNRNTKEDIEKEKEKLILEMDLSILGDLDLPKDEDEAEAVEPNELGLPFKSHAPNSVAKEIDASIQSHSPLEYRLRKITLAKPDYSGLMTKQHIPMSRIQLDPRLRRYSNKSGKKETTPDPEAATKKPDAENVYNPSRDLFGKNDVIQDVYSPSQDVQDLYKPPAALLERPPPAFGDSYNPRQDLARLASPWENDPFQAPNPNPNPNPAPVKGDPRRRDPRRRD